MKLRAHISGLKEEIERLGAVGNRNLPISIAATLTRTASLAQKQVRQVTLPTHFTLRRPAWAKSGVRMIRATKAKLEAQVMDINPYMVPQEEGGEKFPHGKALAVPLKGARPSLKSIIRPENRPKAVMDNGGFIRNGIMYKVKKGSGGRSKIVPMYALVDAATIKPGYEFTKAVRDIVDANLQAEFRKAFAEFVASDKKK